jgi:hypothetical protein
MNDIIDTKKTLEKQLTWYRPFLVCNASDKCVVARAQSVWSNLSHRPSHHHHQNPLIQRGDAGDRFCCSSLADFAMVDGGAHGFCLVSSKASSQVKIAHQW